MIAFLPRLRNLRSGSRVIEKERIVVFVHGIFSSHRTFDTLADSFIADQRFDDYDLAAFDYDWGESILMSAQRLRSILKARLPQPHPEVTLIGHSMGGLVSRFAVIAGELPCVKRIIMLGTPNFGALNAAQLSTLWQVAVAAAGAVTPIFPRKLGLRDLTRIQSTYLNVVKDNPDAPHRARGVEYVTIPGLYYHDERLDADPGKQGAALPFAIGTLLVNALSTFKLGKITIRRPHDGIVEESSVSLIPRQPGRVSEKSLSIQESAKYGRSYAHVTPVSVLERTHMAIQSDARVAEAIKGVMLARNIVQWRDALSRDERETYINIELP